MSDDYLEKEFQRRASFESVILDALKAILDAQKAIQSELEAIRAGSKAPVVAPSTPKPADEDWWCGKDVGWTREQSADIYGDSEPVGSPPVTSVNAEGSSLELNRLRSNLDEAQDE